jgi:DNA-binding NarL/FixJ family response regulator
LLGVRKACDARLVSLADVRVLIVEDERWVRESLEHALASNDGGLCHAGTAANATEALSLVEAGLVFDVALVDLGLPDLPGAELIARLRALRPGAIAVVFTVYDDAPHLLSALRAGAQGYLLKSSSVEKVLTGLREAAQGGAPMTPSIARMVINALREQVPGTASPDDGARLTPREKEVLVLLAKGQTYAAVSSALSIGLGTVQGHVKRIYEKLSVDSKAEAATAAQRMGLI